MKYCIFSIVSIVLGLSTTAVTAQAWNASGQNTSNYGLTLGSSASPGDIRLMLIKSTNTGYSFVFRDTNPGNDTYLYHSFAPNHHIIGSSKNGTGVLRKLSFAVGTADNETDIKMSIDASGNVSIGTLDPKGYKLAVAGKVISEEVVIKLQSAWPDYVFKPGFYLRPLPEVREYIARNGHLPDVPTEEKVAKDGIEVGDMQAVLLKKIEELTLYLLQQEANAKKQEKIISEQNERIKALELLIAK
jgi:hypothetical protein